MIPDPLSSFYQDCRSAPVPSTLTVPPLPAPWWLRLSVPAAGLSIGAVLAFLLISLPTQGSSKDAADIARAIASIQMRRMESTHLLASTDDSPEKAEVPAPKGSGRLHSDRWNIGVLKYRGERRVVLQATGTLATFPSSPFSLEPSNKAKVQAS